MKNTLLVKSLYDLNDDQFCIIGDGTYCYCEKSTNNSVQKLCFSVQKSRHLVKPFVICTANGFIIDVYGPFPAAANDASILKHILETNEDLKNLIKVRSI